MIVVVATAFVFDDGDGNQVLFEAIFIYFCFLGWFDWSIFYSIWRLYGLTKQVSICQDNPEGLSLNWEEYSLVIWYHSLLIFNGTGHLVTCLGEIWSVMQGSPIHDHSAVFSCCWLGYSDIIVATFKFKFVWWELILLHCSIPTNKHTHSLYDGREEELDYHCTTDCHAVLFDWIAFISFTCFTSLTCSLFVLWGLRTTTSTPLIETGP